MTVKISKVKENYATNMLREQAEKNINFENFHIFSKSLDLFRIGP